jgi:hypothetical protein
MTQEFTPIEKGKLRPRLNYLYGTEINGKKNQPFREKDEVKIYKARTPKFMDKLREEYHILLKNYEGSYSWDFDRKTLHIDGGD